MATPTGAKKPKAMNKKNLQHFEKRLLEERKRVLKELGHYDDVFGSTEAFNAAYARKYGGEADYVEAGSAACGAILQMAIEAAGTVEPAKVRDKIAATDTETFTIEILPPEAPTITTEALSSGTVGEFYCCGNLFASGGVQPYTWSVVAGALPAGLELPRRENTISGTPTTAGTFSFTVRVTDDLGAFSDKALSITIS